MLVIAVVAFVGVAALVGGAALLFSSKPASKIEDRLDILTGITVPASKEAAAKEASILTQPLDDKPGIIELFLDRFGNIALLFEQADTSLTVPKFGALSAIMGVGGIVLALVLRIHPAMMPLVGLLTGSLPLCWVLMRRKRRLKAFARNCPRPWR